LTCGIRGVYHVSMNNTQPPPNPEARECCQDDVAKPFCGLPCERYVPTSPDIFPPTIEALREVFEITAYRHGAVYSTVSHGLRWLPLAEAEKPPKGWLYCAPSSNYIGPVVRTV
jgi:hypothetical protein